jgi:protein-tyrosine-phosphatase
MSTPFKILFVCMGNICRSPTAEGVFQIFWALVSGTTWDW